MLSSDPLPAPQVEQVIAFPRPAWEPPRPHTYALAGREQELQEMQRILSAIAEPAAGAHVPRFLGLSGEVGVGKTRLAEALSHEAQAQGWAVMWSSDGKTRQHLLPFFLETLAACMASHTQHTPALPTKSPPVRAGKLEQRHLWESVRELLFAFCHVYPLLLVLDDLQSQDEESINLLGYLLNHCQEQRVLIAGTWREGELVHSPALATLLRDLRRKQALVSWQIEPLAGTEVASMLAHLPQDMARRIQRQAAGNPLFVEELVRQSEQAPAQMPAGIVAIFEQQLSKVSAGCQALLARAAQAAQTTQGTELGATFEFSQLPVREQAEETLLDLLEEALQAKLLYEEGAGAQITYRFWHPLLLSYLREHLSGHH